MSGGVDSTVSTLLLKEQGYEVEGVYMKLHAKPGYHEIHQVRAQRAADFAGVKLHILDLKEEFNAKVFTPFIETYKEGKTPNPCALCNRNIKFGAMVAYADKIGAEFVATGHYIRHDGQYLLQAKDDTKDQSYFLFSLRQEQLARSIFPLGNLTKIDTRLETYRTTLTRQYAAMDQLVAASKAVGTQIDQQIAAWYNKSN